MNNHSPKQILAAFLFISLLWSFAACSILCGELGCDDERANSDFYSIHDASQTAQCPITEAAKAMTSERIAFDSFAFTPAAYRQTFVPKLKLQVEKIHLPQNAAFFISPPLKLLPVLRI